MSENNSASSILRSRSCYGFPSSPSSATPGFLRRGPEPILRGHLPCENPLTRVCSSTLEEQPPWRHHYQAPFPLIFSAEQSRKGRWFATRDGRLPCCDLVVWFRRGGDAAGGGGLCYSCPDRPIVAPSRGEFGCFSCLAVACCG